LGSLGRLALGHPALEVSNGKYAGSCRLRRAAVFGHDLPPFLNFSFLLEPLQK
jgi:hypothetical protein